jgi:hypothetical protein
MSQRTYNRTRGQGRGGSRQLTRHDIQAITNIKRNEDHYRVMSDDDMEVWRVIRFPDDAPGSKLPEDQARVVVEHARHLSDDMKVRLQQQPIDAPYVISADGNIHFYKSGCFRLIPTDRDGVGTVMNTLRDRWAQALVYIRKTSDLPDAVCHVHCFARKGPMRETTEIFYSSIEHDKRSTAIYRPARTYVADLQQHNLYARHSGRQEAE